MAVYYVGYDLYDGFIHNWLVAGPRTVPVPDLDRYREDDFKQQIVRRHHQKSSGIGPSPVQEATFTTKGAKLTWRYLRCLDDHLVDLSAFYPTCHLMRAWAYARVMSPSAQEATFVLTTDGPANLWLNKWHTHRQENFDPSSVSFSARLEKGHNEILLRLEQVALRECPFAMALQVVGDFEENPVLLPTSQKSVERRKTLERIFEAAYVHQDVYAWDDEIAVHWPEDLEPSDKVTAALQTPSGRTYAEAHEVGTPGDRVGLQRPNQIPEGPYQVRLMPQPQEYYDLNMRVQRKINLWALRGQHSQTPYGSYAERRQEALEDAVGRKDNVFSEIAKMALGRWSDIKTDVVLDAIEGINQCSVCDLLGLLGMMHRYGQDPSFPGALKGPLEGCILNFKYWADEPGDDATDSTRHILFHACAILAGQLYPDRAFEHAGKTGQWHREQGEQRAITWLHERCTGGFRQWDADLQTHVLALAHLVDLADEQQI